MYFITFRDAHIIYNHKKSLRTPRKQKSATPTTAVSYKALSRRKSRRQVINLTIKILKVNIIITYYILFYRKH